MTNRTNKRAIYAKLQGSLGADANPNLDNSIPVNEISNTPLVADEVERDELVGYFGAKGKAIANKTQAISVTAPIIGSTVSSKKPALSPLHPLIIACYHEALPVGADLTSPESGGAIRANLYKPTDGDGTPATLAYVYDKFLQKALDARGTMSLNMTTGQFSTMTFEMQAPFSAPTTTGVPVTGGTRPRFVPSELVTGNGTLRVPGLPADLLANCVRSFTFTQNATISSKDCATIVGDNSIEYIQTNRESTGEIVVDIDETKLAKFYEVAGTENGFAAPLSVEGSGGTAAQTFVFGASNILLGAPTEGDTDGIGTYTIPLTFRPIGAETDYRFGWVGDITSS